MSLETAPRRREDALVRPLAGLGALIGVVTLGGWAVGVPVLKSVGPALPTMKANAALAFVLAGAALWGLSASPAAALPEKSGTRRLAAIAGAVTALIGLVTLAQYVLAMDLGIDRLLWHDPGPSIGTSHPGRMAPAAALGFVFLGVGILALDRPRGASLAQALAAGTVVTILPAAVGYLYGVAAAPPAVPASRIAVHAVVAMLALAAGLFFVRSEQGWASVLVTSGAVGQGLRVLVLATLVVPVILGVAVRVIRDTDVYDPEVALVVVTTVATLLYAIASLVHAFLLRRSEADRARAEADLRDTEKRKGAVIDAALDCVITIDHEGAILDFNPAAEATFGYPRDSVAGRELAAILVPERLREQHREALRRYLASGEASVMGTRLEMPALHADGREIPVELAITAITVKGRPVFTAYLRDITDRLESERALRRSLDRAEVLLREVHHRVKNNLQVISSLLSLEARQSGNPVVDRFFRRTSARVRSIARFHEHLYARDDIDRIGTAEYFRDVAVDTDRTVGSGTSRIEVDVEEPVASLTMDLAVPAGLIVGELVGNAVKHAGNGSEVRRRILVGFRGGRDEALLSVEDDGPGFSEEWAEAGERGLGLTIVEALARQVGGEVEIGTSTELGGARVAVRVGRIEVGHPTEEVEA